MIIILNGLCYFAPMFFGVRLFSILITVLIFSPLPVFALPSCLTLWSCDMQNGLLFFSSHRAHIYLVLCANVVQSMCPSGKTSDFQVKRSLETNI